MAEAPAPKQLPTTVYDKMQFPEYEFREFPMAVPMVDGVPCFDPDVLKKPYDFSNPRKPKPYPIVTVKSQEELNQLRAGEVEVTPPNPHNATETQRVVTEDEEREALYVRAEQLKVKIDKRWSVERIEKAISDAEKAEEPVV